MFSPVGKHWLADDRAVPYNKGRMLVKVHPSFRNEIVVSEGRSAAFRVWLNF